MINAISYQTAQHLDNAQYNQWTIIIIIALILIILGAIILLIDLDLVNISLALLIIGLLGVSGVCIWTIFADSKVEMVAKRDLPSLQQKLETLKSQRLKAIHTNKPNTEIKTLNQKIADTQSTITKYNNIIIANDDNN